jgi:hypothetical protein
MKSKQVAHLFAIVAICAFGAGTACDSSNGGPQTGSGGSGGASPGAGGASSHGGTTGGGGTGGSNATGGHGGTAASGGAGGSPGTGGQAGTGGLTGSGGGGGASSPDAGALCSGKVCRSDQFCCGPPACGFCANVLQGPNCQTTCN